MKHVTDGNKMGDDEAILPISILMFFFPNSRENKLDIVRPMLLYAGENKRNIYTVKPSLFSRGSSRQQELGHVKTSRAPA